ncbi:MAG TPA: 30S ribosomal protein S12 methylthiotransferase RimO [Longimicrobiales bacterium]|nr:30S ribosomal protein S12 methylthiotransferase RimO [Longimicrobiales bacterium]
MTSKTKRLDLPVLGAKTKSAGSTDSADSARVSIITLGCDKNTVDSERIMARLANSGAQVGAAANNADVIVINTCGFIESAKEESIETIPEAVKLKKQRKVKVVVAMGCLVQRYKAELEAEIPEVDAFLSLTETDELVPVLKARGLLPDEPASVMERPLRLLSTSTPHTSYLKISEGCDHTCAFCAIPLMRGKHRSTPMHVLISEAQQLEQSGVKELNIVSQDTTWYGRDINRGIAPTDNYFVGAFPQTQSSPIRQTAPSLDRRIGLQHLLQALIAETSIPWLRLFYMYPSGITRELVDFMAREPRVLPYLDMPLQHGSDRILEKMRRPERVRTIRERVSWLRGAIPDLALRTTLIVGFPGETDDDFQELIDLVEEIRFDYMGAFTYSVEEGTHAAEMGDTVPADVKRERLEQLLDVQRTITLDKNESRIGTVQSVLIDKPGVGRTKGQALEVDGVVNVAGAESRHAGEFVQVRITDAMEHDLAGQMMETGS